MKKYFNLILIFFIFSLSIYADKGSFSVYPVKLSQESQKAIILHNFKEEVLILGTEMIAEENTDVLEFIPFPSEPKVTLSNGNPFQEIKKLIKIKKIEMVENRWKGGASSASVDITFSEKIGLHDVTTVKINDINGFSNWVKEFLKNKGIKNVDERRLNDFFNIADDYIKRGISYFVFDYVSVKKEKKFIEPLIYRFKSDRLYYPLKTSNFLGGSGKIELILILPGTLCIKEDCKDIIGIVSGGSPLIEELKESILFGAEILSSNLSSSSKLYLNEVKQIYEDADEFFNNVKKIYLQAFIYNGPYNFKEDLNHEISKIAPYARKVVEGRWFVPIGWTYETGLTMDEEMDLREAQCKELTTEEMFCYPFIHSEEYRVISAIFENLAQFEIREGLIFIEEKTRSGKIVRKTLQKLGNFIEELITKSFNRKNEREHEWEKEHITEVSEGVKIIKKGEFSQLAEKENVNLLRFSRVGFDSERNKAIVYFEIETEGKKTAYYVGLNRKNGKWYVALVNRIKE